MVAGNYIGLNAAGTGSVANSNTGITVSGTGIRVGTDADGTSDALERNIIANSGVGISVTNTGVIITGNYIGTNAAGTAALGSSQGINLASGGTGARIGTNGDGTNDSVEGNVISGNKKNGIVFSAGVGTATITIGTNGDGTSDAAEANVIAGNTQEGILLTGSYSGNVVAGNYIGVASNGTTDLGNGRHGISIAGGITTTTIGGDISAEANTIAYNGDAASEYGLYLSGASTDGNQILRNSFFNNQNEGIKLNNDGANNDQAAPSITSRSITGGHIDLIGTSTASATVQIFEADSDSQEGKVYLGQATADGSGNWLFTLTAPYDSNGRIFVATATDATNGTSQFSSSYTLGNNAPTATGQTVTATEDTNSGVTLGLTDADGGDTTTASIVTLPASGALYQTADGTTLGAAITSAPTTVTDSSKRVIYVPAVNANGNGIGNFTFNGTDGLNTSATATVTVNVTAVNDAPSANAQTLSLNEDTPKGIVLAGADVDGNPLTYVVFVTPNHGSLSGLNAGTGGVVYTPASHYHGTDSFSFRAYDATEYSGAAVVSLTIVHVNHAPTASARTASTTQNTAVNVTFSASDSDSDTLTYSIVSNPGHGSLSGLNASAGTVTYTPNTDYSGTDTFTYRAGDGTANSSAATVTVTITESATNHAPTVFAGNDLTAVEGSTVRLAGSATDADGDSLTYRWSQSAGTTVSLSNANQATAGFVAPGGGGSLQFLLTVSDGHTTASDSMTVALTPKNFSMEDAVKLDGRVVAANAGMAITKEEGAEYDGREATAVDLENGSALYSTDTTPVEVVILDDRVVVGDPAWNDSTGVVVMVDPAVLPGKTKVDLNDPDFADIGGVIVSYGNQKGDLFGFVVKSADVDGDGSNEIVSLAPGTSNGTVYVLSGSDLETVNLIRGSEAEQFKTSLLLTTDVNGADGTDLLIGLPDGASPSISALKGSVPSTADIDSSSSVFDGILGSDDLPALIDLASEEADFVLTAGGSVSLVAGGDLDANGSEDTVVSAGDGFGVDVIFGSSGVGADVTALAVSGSFVSGETDPADSLAVGDVTGDGYADVVLGFASASGGEGKIVVVSGREDWDETAYDLVNAIVVEGLSGDGIGAWLVIADGDDDGVEDIYTNDGADGTYLIALAGLIDSGGGGGGSDGGGGGHLGAGGFGCSLDAQESSGDLRWMILFVGLFGGFLLLKKFQIPNSKFQTNSKKQISKTKKFGNCFFGIWCLVLGIFLIGCGSARVPGSGDGSDEGEEGGGEAEGTLITLSGRITVPTAETGSASLSAVKHGARGAGHGARYVVNEGASGILCDIYDLGGNFLSDATTNSGGDFAATVPVVDSDETTARLVISCENGIHNYAEVDISGGSVSLDTGTADPDTTLATLALADDMEEWNGWGEDHSDDVSGKDLECLFGTHKGLWEEADADAGGLSDDNAMLKDVLEGFWAGGGTPEDVGYEDWPTLLHDVIDGEAPEGSVWGPMVETASAINDAIDVSEYTSGYSDASEAFQTVSGTLSEQIDALYESAGATGDTTPADICEGIKEGAFEAGAVVGPLLAAGDIDEFRTVYGNANGMLLHFNLLKQCQEEGTCEEMAEKPAAFLGFMKGFDGNYSGVFDASHRPDSNTLQGIFHVAENCTGSSSGSLKTCGEGMHDMVYQGGGWSAFQDSGGQFDTARFTSWGNVWTNYAGISPGGDYAGIPPAPRGLFGTQSGTTVTINPAAWKILFGSGLANLAEMWTGNTILFSADDAFPALTTSAFSGIPSLPVDPSQKAIVIETSASSYVDSLRTGWSLPDEVMARLEANDQAYAIAQNSSGNILILGGSPRGAFYGVIDFIKDLDASSTSSATWTSKSLLNYPNIGERMVWDVLSSCDIDSFFNYGTTLDAIAHHDFTCSGSPVSASDMRAAIDMLVWNKATGLHLYEYIGSNAMKPSYANLTSSYADFVGYLDDRFVSELPHLSEAWATAPYTDYEGLGQFAETFKLVLSSGVYKLVPTSTAYDVDAGAAINLIPSPYSEFVGSGSCASSEKDCFYWNPGDSTGSFSTNSASAISTPSADGASLCIQQDSASLGPPAASYTIDSSHLEAGKYYALGYYVYQSSAVTAWQVTLYSVLNDSSNVYNSDVSITKDTDATPAAGDWKYHTFIFRVPDSAVYSNPAVNRTYFFMRMQNGTGTACLDKVQLHALAPQLLNVLSKQGITVTNSAGNVTYASGTHFTATNLYTANSAPADYFNSTGGGGVGTKAVINWNFTDSNSDGADDATGLQVNDQVKVTYSSLLKNGAGIGFAWFPDPTVAGFDTGVAAPFVAKVLQAFTPLSRLPRFGYYYGATEVRGIRRGTSTGQQGLSNGEYATKLDNTVANSVAQSYHPGPDELRPLFFADNATLFHNGDANYQVNYSGHAGSMTGARAYWPPNSVVMPWGSKDCPAFFTDEVHDFYVDDYGASNPPRSYSSIGNANYYDTGDMKNWMSLAAGNSGMMLGVIATNWQDRSGKKGLIQNQTETRNYLKAAWDPGYAQVKVFKTADRASYISGGAFSSLKADAFTCGYAYPSSYKFGSVLLSSGQEWQSGSVDLASDRDQTVKVRVYAHIDSGGDPSPTLSAQINYYNGTANQTAAGAFSNAKWTTFSYTGSYAAIETGGIDVPGADSIQIKLTASASVRIDSVVVYQATPPLDFPDSLSGNPYYQE
ncbi:MAG: tandem-95 repeat protein [Deltaproteobacteria bacterium]|nr:tandem-95 repeat protein [Deltaproteobacteria bacterium]